MIGLKEIINRIKCKLFVCCKVSCNEALDIVEEELEEELEEQTKIHYDYYSGRRKSI